MSDLHGLTPSEVEENRKKNGTNDLTQIPPEPLWKKILESFKQPMIMILIVALALETVVCGSEAYMGVDVVGDKTLFGQLALEVQENSRAPPLQANSGTWQNRFPSCYIGACGIIIAILLQNFLTGNILANWHDKGDCFVIGTG